jgi:hypothetical protein
MATVNHTSNDTTAARIAQSLGILRAITGDLNCDAPLDAKEMANALWGVEALLEQAQEALSTPAG